MIKQMIAVLFLVVLSFMLGAFISQFISLKKEKPIVREPAVPEESTLAYTPPPPPRFPLETIIGIRDVMKKLATPRIEKVTDDVYAARGFALGSVQMIVTKEGLVIVDSTESPEAANKILQEFRKISDQPIRYLIFTHAHMDHIQGARVFMKDGPEVIATEDFLTLMEKDFTALRAFQERARLNQSGQSAIEYARKLPRNSPMDLEYRGDALVRPTIVFEKTYRFTLGGKTFELYHAAGETPDHLMIWLPEERALFCGDLFYNSFPNLSSPMLEARAVKAWYLSMDRMMDLKPAYLVPNHSNAITGEKIIFETLTQYRHAIQFVFEKTLQCINDGKTVDEAVHLVKLPDALSGLPYLREVYGRVEWAVRGIYQGGVGWYDGNGTKLSPLPPAVCARELVFLSGGADKILARAIKAQQAGEHQLACELCDIVITANSGDKLAHIIKASSLEAMGYNAENLNMFGFYRSAASLERKAAGVKP